MIRSLAIIAVLAAIGAGLYSQRSQAGICPCGIGAAAVRATGAYITTFTLGLITEMSLALQMGFASMERQIGANTSSAAETLNHQSQVLVNITREAEAHRSNMDALSPPQAGTSMTATSAASGAELVTELNRDAIEEAQRAWSRNNTAATEGSGTGNAFAHMGRTMALYCSETEAAIGICELPDDPRMIAASTSTQTLMRENTLDEDLQNAAVDYCRNVLGLPPPRQEVQQIISLSGAVAGAERVTLDARRSLAFAVCDHLVALRSEIPDEQLRAWAEEMIKNLTGGVGMPATYNGYPMVYGGAGIALNDATHTPFSDGMQTAFSNLPQLDAEQAARQNYLYSQLRNAGMTPEAAMAWTLHSIHETSGGMRFGEVGGDDGAGSFQFTHFTGPRVGEGTNVGNLPKPGAGRNWERADFIPASEGGNAASVEEAIANSAAAHVQNLQANHPQLYSASTRGGYSVEELARLSTFDYIRNGGPGDDRVYQEQRVQDIVQTFQMNAGGIQSNLAGSPGAGTGAGSPTGSGNPGSAANPNFIVPTSGRLTSCFGVRRHPIRGTVSNHRGVDYAAGEGSPVLAAQSGTVHHGNQAGGAGLYITIRHDNGWTTRYMHLSGFAVPSGTRVEAGQVIGYEGNTGGSTGSHLHFETISPDGDFINPRSVLPGGGPGGSCGRSLIEELASIDGNGVGTPAGGGLPSVAGGFTPQMPQNTADLGLNELADNISHYELMRLISTYRMQDPAWSEFVTVSANEPQLLRELITLQAIRGYLKWQSFELQMLTSPIWATFAGLEANDVFFDEQRGRDASPGSTSGGRNDLGNIEDAAVLDLGDS